VTRLGPDTTADDVRVLAEPPANLEADVRAILDAVREGGDAAVREYTLRFDGAAPGELRVPAEQLEAAPGALGPDVLDALGVAIANVSAVADAQLHDTVGVELPQGQRVEIVEVPVRRAAAYVPGGRAAYPSTVVMCAVSARAAGVEELAVCAPPGPDGVVHPAVLAACSLCGVTEVYAMGGAQAIAALAYGTESVPAVDVVVGPGNSYVQEAKRQLAGAVGIDSVAGPSELVVVASEGADPALAAADLMAQGEHGADSLVAALSPDTGLLDQIEAQLDGAGAALVETRDVPAAIALAEELAPEHLQLMGSEAEALADTVRFAGCLFVGRDAGTAFGDYVAGSNHVLPTSRSARFSSGLSLYDFIKRTSIIRCDAAAFQALAGPTEALARAEGLPAHARSVSIRRNAPPRGPSPRSGGG